MDIEQIDKKGLKYGNCFLFKILILCTTLHGFLTLHTFLSSMDMLPLTNYIDNKAYE